MNRGVPYDHQLEYIESSGSQYIDTGFTATDTMSYKGKIMPTGLAYNSGMFGYRFVNSATAYGNMRFSFVYSDGRIGLRNGLEIQNSTNKMVVGSIYQIEVDNQYFKVNGDIWISANNRKAAMTPPGKAWLFFVNCTGYYNTDVQHPITMRMYSWQIFDNGAIVRDFIPVSVNGVAMIYDRVTGTFPKHYGTFVAGPVASTPLMGVHMYQAANLWKQPTMATWQSATPSTIWSPIPGVVYTSLADNGYSNSRFYDPFADGPDTIISTYSGGYCATVFLNLPPGNYVFKAKTDVNSNFRLLHYIPVETGWRISYGVNWGVKTAGKITYAFTIPQNEMIAVYFRTQNGGTIKTTDISITEAAP